MRYLGIDYGLKKVGLALSEGQIASPFKVIDITSLKDAVNKISSIIEKEQIDRVIVGVPESGQSKNAVKQFLNEIKAKLKEEEVSIIEADETLSSSTAIDLMVDLNTSRESRQKEDAYSASIILQNFLDSIA